MASTPSAPRRPGPPSARLTGRYSCHEGPCWYYFRWGQDGVYPYTEPLQGPFRTAGEISVAYSVEGLEPHTGYLFQICSGASAVRFTCSGPSGGAGGHGTITTGGTEPAHIPTWAYDDYSRGSCNSGRTPADSPAWAREWLTFAESKCGQTAFGRPGEPEEDVDRAGYDCHAPRVAYCTALAYLDTDRLYSNSTDSILSDPRLAESWFEHMPGITRRQADGHRARSYRLCSGWQRGWRSCDDGGPMPTLSDAYLPNIANPAVTQHFEAYVRSRLAPVRPIRDRVLCGPCRFDGLMMDDVSAYLAGHLDGTCADYDGVGGWSCPAGSPSLSSYEIPTDAALLSAREREADAMSQGDGAAVLQVDNGISDNPYLPVYREFELLNHPSGVLGLVAESQPWDRTIQPSWEYATLLDEIAHLETTYPPYDFMALLSYDTAGSPTARMVQEATVLLGWHGAQVVDWADLEDASPDLAVWPEEGIVPSDPVQSMSGPTGVTIPGGRACHAGGGSCSCLGGHGQLCAGGGHVSLEVAPGIEIYRREFRRCYEPLLTGAKAGPCAVVMNDTRTVQPLRAGWLTQRYGHVVSQGSLIGGDLESGGRIDFNRQRLLACTSTPCPPDATTIPAGDAVLLMP